MTEDEINTAYNVLDALYAAIKTVVDAATEALTEEQDELVRTRLAENVRFWRTP